METMQVEGSVFSELKSQNERKEMLADKENRKNNVDNYNNSKPPRPKQKSNTNGCTTCEQGRKTHSVCNRKDCLKRERVKEKARVKEGVAVGQRISFTIFFE